MTEEKKHLYVLWTTGDPVTAEKMVLMYTTNALRFGWWEAVTLVVWGAATQLAAENAGIQKRLAVAQETGVEVLACKACADQLGVAGQLEALGIAVQYLGIALTNVLKNEEPLLTV
ncbi:MAG: DsrE family protein [Anaerolineae bacterium]|nr:DsrE family protein [Anaerolineae bacterium]